MNYNVEINIDNIRKFSRDIISEGNKLINIIDEITKDIDELNLIFNTTTGVLFEEKLKEVLSNQKKYVNEKYIPYSKTIDKIASIYENTNYSISSSIRG